MRDEIFIKGARANNLQNVDLGIPRNRLTVVTGVSGSGKSSITIDTLYAEGQRRYVESLSSYARQFLMRMKKPDLDYIEGICPAIAIEQKVSTRNSRSTVGSLTEIYDFLRLLYARIGRTISPISGKEVKKHSVADVVNFLKKQEEDEKIFIYIPIQDKYDRPLAQDLDLLAQKGFTRVRFKKDVIRIEDLLDQKKLPPKNQLEILIDRALVKHEDEDNFNRLADSALTAFQESEGTCIVETGNGTKKTFNNRFELDGIEFPEPSIEFFNYNNPYGACPSCEGYGNVIGIDEYKVVPDRMKSVNEDAIACWRGAKFGKLKNDFLKVAHEFDFPIHRSYMHLSESEKKILWDGNEYVKGIRHFFKKLEQKTYKIQNRVMLARYRGKTKCPECKGLRLRKEAFNVKIDGTAITDLVGKSIKELLEFFSKIKLNKADKEIAQRLLLEVVNRLEFMRDVGLEYLTLERMSSTLSGGETQRINLTRTLGSNLTDSMYILDEPSVGLHPKDTEKLIRVLKSLRDLGNTVIVVEHEEEVIKNADYLVDMGPQAGINGGHVVYAGDYKNIFKQAPESLTVEYMTGKREVPLPKVRRKVNTKISIKGAREHNLSGIDVDFPLHAMTVVTGVSGSGKTTLVKKVLFPALKELLEEPHPEKPGSYDSLEGQTQLITHLEMVNQNPIGRSSRSNPVTYVKAYDSIRDLFASQQLSKMRGYKPKHFSFNVDGGRCETCKGEGEILVEMQFLADVRLECEECQGKRFRREVLEVKYHGKNIFNILELSIDEAMEFFASARDVIRKIKPLQDVGLGYVKLGQSSNTLSGGEAQRVKLASFLGKESPTEHYFFIFDEPTTGLHFHDINRLLDALNRLVNHGHTVLIVEHNMEVIKSADWVIDLGPGGGEYGGQLIYQGPPEGLAKIKKSHTGKFLKEKLG